MLVQTGMVRSSEILLRMRVSKRLQTERPSRKAAHDLMLSLPSHFPPPPQIEHDNPAQGI